MSKLSSKYIGIITGIVMVAVALLLFYVFKLPAAGEAQYAVWGLYTAGIIWALVSYKSSAPADASFKNYFSEGFKCFVVAALIMVVYTFIFYKMNPQILEDAIRENNALILKEGNHIGPEIKENADKFRSIFIPAMMMTNTIIYLILGALVSVVGAGLLSQKKV